MIAVPLNSLVPDFVLGFDPYIPSKPDDVLRRMYGCDHLHRLNNNENALGPPPGAAEIIGRFPPPKASIYPSGDAYHLRRRLSGRLGVSPDQILVGNGANEVITFIIKAFCQQGDNVVTADKTFAVYEWVAEFSGFEARLVPLRDFGFDAAGMLERVDDRTKILFLCNPNNPTGAYWSRDKLEAFLNGVAGRRIVVVDEAYFEFCTRRDYPNAVEWIERHPNLVVFRTFSKMYALAGLRVGYLVGDREVVDVVRRTAVVYSVNSLAQDAALAALDDDCGHVQRTRDMVERGKAYLKDSLTGMGLEVVSGEGNFVMVHLPVSDTFVYQKLMARGVMVRTMTGFRFPNWIRISIGQMDALTALVRHLGEVLEEADRGGGPAEIRP